MIVELFGPPGSGKSTFAHELARQLCERGCDVEVVRPVSREPRTRNALSDIFGIGSSLTRILSAMRSAAAALLLSRQGNEVGLANALVNLVPQSSWSRRIRLWQYILRLAFHWNQAGHSSGVRIFDQGFVQAVASLVVLRGSADIESIENAMRLLPRSDLAVRVVVPRNVNEQRLIERSAGEGLAGRLFEPPAELFFEADSRMFGNSIGVFNYLNDLREQDSLATVSVLLIDQKAFEEGIRTVQDMIVAAWHGHRADR
jgi:hypothetical protein